MDLEGRLFFFLNSKVLKRGSSPELLSAVNGPQLNTFDLSFSNQVQVAIHHFILTGLYISIYTYIENKSFYNICTVIYYCIYNYFIFVCIILVFLIFLLCMHLFVYSFIYLILSLLLIHFFLLMYNVITYLIHGCIFECISIISCSFKYIINDVFLFSVFGQTRSMDLGF